MAKLFQVEDMGVTRAYFFDCPGCTRGHFLPVCPYRAENGACWNFDGNLAVPTFRPDVVSRFVHPHTHIEEVCHFFLTTGLFYFFPDCTHSLAGRIVPMKNVGD